LDFVKNQNSSTLKRIFLSHGEEESMLEFKEDLNQLGYTEVFLPMKNESFVL
jgi:metallo-beta-lactamase family protein